MVKIEWNTGNMNGGNIFKKVRLAILLIGILGAVLAVLFFVAGSLLIGYDVKKQCSETKKEYGGDCVDATILLLQDESKELRKKNSAIWALGQLGDKRALPVLQSFYTGNIPVREPLNGTISQYELKKAINLTSGGINITAFIWRGFLSGD